MARRCELSEAIQSFRRALRMTGSRPTGATARHCGRVERIDAPRAVRSLRDAGPFG